jgi:hypothetical protein
MVLLEFHLQAGVGIHGWGGGALESHWLRVAENGAVIPLIFSSSDVRRPLDLKFITKRGELTRGTASLRRGSNLIFETKLT